MNNSSNSEISVVRPNVVDRISEMQTTLAKQRRAGRRIGLVPTMGALHEGHLSLMRAARTECDFCIATIFVNPAQFGPHEDLDKYPRTLDADLNMLGREGIDLVFVPSVKEIYPPGFSTYIDPPAVSRPLEGECRPGHFRGVATVVMKLFQMTAPDLAYFGQKDFQQCLVIRHMVVDLNVPVEIRICPTVREADGLAMSSRNRYLNETERRQALAVSRSLAVGTQRIQDGETHPDSIIRNMKEVLTDAGIQRIDYIAIRDPDSLAELDRIKGRVVLLVAAFVGGTRLIDNRIVG